METWFWNWKRAKQFVFCVIVWNALREPKVTSACLSSQFGQVQPQQQQQAANVAAGNQQMQTGNTQEEDADPQKRLQATLQLAAALLQQIQQGKGNWEVWMARANMKSKC